MLNAFVVPSKDDPSPSQGPNIMCWVGRGSSTINKSELGNLCNKVASYCAIV